jgi:integrase
VRTLCDAWKSRLGPTTRYIRTQRLKRLLSHIAEVTGIYEPLKAVSVCRRPGPRQIIATPDEIEALVRHAQPWLRGIVLLATHAGLRRSDCMRIAPMHYEAEKRQIAIQQKKTGRTVVVPVTETLAKWLDAAEPATITTPFYEAYRGKPITFQGLKGAWRTLKKRAKVNPELWLHDLRRTAAVTLYQLTKDLTAVEAFLGHASLSSTCGYLEHKDPGKLKPYIDQMWRPKGKETVQ